ncbi:MAG: hypothetical protein [Wigfec virus K19_83]|nr:MAG: hypothetical protein [Wigfec virus K19_83]
MPPAVRVWPRKSREHELKKRQYTKNSILKKRQCTKNSILKKGQ